MIFWHNPVGAVARERVYEELRRTSQHYVAVEEMPHEPPILGHYYISGKPDPSDGETLRKLLDRFNPATDIDRDLIQAALMTCFWGGQGGSRPAFVITSDDGRGAGKSTVAKMIGLVAGGIVDFSAKEDIGQVKTRLLTPDALTRRVALLVLQR